MSTCRLKAPSVPRRTVTAKIWLLCDLAYRHQIRFIAYYHALPGNRSDGRWLSNTEATCIIFVIRNFFTALPAVLSPHAPKPLKMLCCIRLTTLWHIIRCSLAQLYCC
jgi:hypothetical protein